MIREFPKKEVGEVLDIHPDTILYYARNELVVPKIQSHGRGTRPLYSRQNLVEFKIVKLLQHGLMPLKMIKYILDIAKNKENGKYLNPEDPFWKTARGEKAIGPWLCIYDIHREDKLKVTIGTIRPELGSHEISLIVNLEEIFTQIDRI